MTIALLVGLIVSTALTFVFAFRRTILQQEVFRYELEFSWLKKFMVLSFPFLFIGSNSNKTFILNKKKGKKYAVLFLAFLTLTYAFLIFFFMSL